MMLLAQEYIRAFEDEAAIDIDLAFSDACPPEQSALWDSSNPACYQLAPQMLESGEVLWGHIAWWGDVLDALKDMATKPYGLVKVRLLADWLLGTLPANPQDPDVAPTLAALAKGEFSEAFENPTCIWPAKAEFYLKTLNWKMLEYCLDAAANDRATAQTWLYQRTGKIV
ncbi:hypothetical protein ACQ4N7_28925 [Nodosilinea sp. AN01ver1]|uniref:hypothetical protein n=1 Tax=Nodosilinea sp. AN01ver1 TaxID=3423362 RepID=UPI003D318C69